MLSIFEGIMSQSTSTNNQSKQLNSTEIVGLIDEQLNLMQQQLDIVKNDVDNQDNLNKLMSICGGVIDNSESLPHAHTHVPCSCSLKLRSCPVSFSHSYTRSP